VLKKNCPRAAKQTRKISLKSIENSKSTSDTIVAGDLEPTGRARSQRMVSRQGNLRSRESRSPGLAELLLKWGSQAKKEV
jgi:hypothetical protein